MTSISSQNFISAPMPQPIIQAANSSNIFAGIDALLPVSSMLEDESYLHNDCSNTLEWFKSLPHSEKLSAFDTLLPSQKISFLSELPLLKQDEFTKKLSLSENLSLFNKQTL